jgi:GT2 family glycosyltransferase
MTAFASAADLQKSSKSTSSTIPGVAHTEEKTWPRVSLLMPNRDNAQVLDTVLEKLAQNTQYPDFELIVVDDESTDGSLQQLRGWRDSGRFDEFRLIERQHTSGGVVDALNQGLAAATGELMVQLDADASIETPGWLTKMVSFFLSDLRIGVVTAKVVTDDGRLQYCGVAFTGGCFSQTCDRIAEVDGGVGVCMMYRRATALEVGGYDRGYAPVSLDDLDLTVSLRRAGLKVFVFPAVVAVHHQGVPEASPRPPPTLSRRIAVRGRRMVGRALPERVRIWTVRKLGWDRGAREYRRRRQRQRAYWRTKWGWDLDRPETLEVIRERWGDTEICWQSDPERRRVGEVIASAFDVVADDVGR